MTEMNRSRLVQRLTKPRDNAFGFKDNPFSFGGGLKNGGLSDTAMDLIRGIFAFDYMGASEFEWGAVPEALQRIAKNAEDGALDFSAVIIPIKTVEKDWRDDRKEEPEGDAVVYILGPMVHLDEIEDRVVQWAHQEPKYPLDFKESSRFSAALRPYGEWPERSVGWLELNNGFFFFIDKEMFEQTCALFGVEVGEIVA